VGNESDVFKVASQLEENPNVTNRKQKQWNKALSKEIARNMGDVTLKQASKEQTLEDLNTIINKLKDKYHGIKFDLLQVLDEDRSFLHQSSEIHVIFSNDSDVVFNTFSKDDKQLLLWVTINHNEASIIDARLLKHRRMIALLPSLEKIVGNRIHLWSRRYDAVDTLTIEDKNFFFISSLISSFWGGSDFGEKWVMKNKDGKEKTLWISSFCKAFNSYLMDFKITENLLTMQGFYEWFCVENKSKGLIESFKSPETFVKVKESLANSGPKVFVYMVGMTKEKITEALNLWTSFVGLDSVDPEQSLAAPNVTIVDENYKFPNFGREKLKKDYKDFKIKKEAAKALLKQKVPVSDAQGYTVVKHKFVHNLKKPVPLPSFEHENNFTVIAAEEKNNPKNNLGMESVIKKQKIDKKEKKKTKKPNPKANPKHKSGIIII